MSRAIEWILLGAGSFAAIIAGVRRHRPARVGPWLLLGAAMVAMATGDILYAVDLQDVADICYLSMFALVGGALVQFTRGGSLIADRARLIDLLAFVCAALLAIWVFLVGDDGSHFSATDVLGDLLLIAVALRLRMATGHNMSATLLVIGSAGMLAADVLYPLTPAPIAEAGYVLLYVTWALAALHPSMTVLTEPMTPRTTPWRPGRAALLCAAVSTPPTVLLIEALRGTVEHGMVIAVAGGVTLLLTITRLGDSIAANGRALKRERGLRTASADLVSAADIAAVDEAVRTAVAQLLPRTAVSQVVFASDNRQVLLQALPITAGGPGTRSWWIEDAPPAPAPRPAPPVVEDPGTPIATALEAERQLPGRTEPAPVPTAPPATGAPAAAPSRRGSAAHSAAEATLVCPLWLEPLSVARPSGGALILTGRRDVLTLARDALEVLAGQAALALDRISLVEAVGRRDSDLYLRTVIRNTADLMLVIDDDCRIRYASPALHELLGVEDLSPLATLDDLVHVDDRSQVRRAFATTGDGTLFFSLRRADQSQVLVEATYRDLRSDRLVQGFVATLRNVTHGHDPVEQVPHQGQFDELPAWINRRSAQHKFRY